LELTDHPDVISHLEAVKRRYPQMIVWIRVPGDLRAPDRVAALAAAGAEVIHLVASEKARGLNDAGDLHLKDLIRRTHLKLVEHQMRDAVTLLASGGIALAEHVAKPSFASAVLSIFPRWLELPHRNEGIAASQSEAKPPVKRAQRLVNLVAPGASSC
jgi:hypothetical protein